MYIFKRHNLGLISAVLLMGAVIACQGGTTPLASTPTSSPASPLTSTPTLQPTPSPTDIIETPTILTPQPQAPCLSSEPIEERAREVLAHWLSISSEEIEMLEVEEVEWPDTSLGCPEPGKAYAEVIVPGCRVVMRLGDEVYEYHAGGEHAVLCDEEGQFLWRVPSPTAAETPILPLACPLQ